jgi:hypothetical protein
LNLSNLDSGDSDELTLIMNHIRDGLALLPLYSGHKRLLTFGYLLQSRLQTIEYVYYVLV